MTVRVAASTREQNLATEETNEMVGNIGKIALASTTSTRQMHQAAEQVAKISERLTGEVIRFRI
jgi:methyl-accepting chemotaxis protein